MLPHFHLPNPEVVDASVPVLEQVSDVFDCEEVGDGRLELRQVVLQPATELVENGSLVEVFVDGTSHVKTEEEKNISYIDKSSMLVLVIDHEH